MDAKVGDRHQVDRPRQRLGTPSTAATFDPNTWYYVDQTATKFAYQPPKVDPAQRHRRSASATTRRSRRSRSTILKDGYKIAYNKRETPTRGRELSVLEQILGNLGRGTTLPTDNDPGNPGGHAPGAVVPASAGKKNAPEAPLSGAFSSQRRAIG